MIKEIRIENIRVFEGLGWSFPLSSLTVFCGTNNSGKSTLLKVLLLLRQTMGIEESYELEEGKLRFFGSQVDLGSYRSLVSHNEVQRDVSIGLSTEGQMPKAVASNLRSVMLRQKKRRAGRSEESVPYCLESDFRFGVIPERDRPPGPPTTPTEDVRDALGPSPKGFLKKADFQLSIGGESVLSWSMVYSGLDEDGDPQFDLLIPEAYFDSIEEFSKVAVDREPEGYARVRVILRDLRPAALIAQLSSGDERWLVLPVPTVIHNLANVHLRETLDRIHYVGPLRAPAERYYITRPDVGQPLDPAGEFLPFVLRDIGEYESWYLPPGLQQEPMRESLFAALNRWIKYIRTGETLAGEVRETEIHWDFVGRVLMEIEVRSPLRDELHALADSGFGYSQLLPIVIRALLAPEDHTVIIEQPELHLNPAIQVRIAEFLAAMALAGTQIVIETHSEHIVNTMRVLAAEDQSGKLASLCRIFYLDVGDECQRPAVHELSVRPDGIVPNWPRQFFGEAASLTGRLLKAQKRSRKPPTAE
jgi:predicted ATPase